MILAGTELELLHARVRVIQDWPKPGVAFQDLSGVLADPQSFTLVIRHLAAAAGDYDLVVGIEARGFAYGAALAHSGETGFITARKPGKLPGAVHAREYELEYGTATLELHQDAIAPGERVLIVDDVLATGGTAAAAIDLVRQCGGRVVGLGVVMEIPGLGGRSVIEGLSVPVHALAFPRAA